MAIPLLSVLLVDPQDELRVASYRLFGISGHQIGAARRATVNYPPPDSGREARSFSR